MEAITGKVPTPLSHLQTCKCAVRRSRAVTNLADSPIRKQAIREVSVLRHEGELKAYMDLLFLGLISLLCIARIIGG